MYTHHGPMLYLTNDDQVVEEGDPRAAFVLVADGGQLPDDIAAKYNLVEGGAAAAEEKAKPAAAEEKAKPAAPETKLKAPAPTNKSK